VKRWRDAELASAPAEPSPADPSWADRTDQLRAAGNLKGARALCLQALTALGENAGILWRAARAEADWVLILRGQEGNTDERNMATASGLDYARRAVEAALAAVRAAEAADGANLDLIQARAWLSYSLGGTTHLLPMGERSARAHATIAAAEQALEVDGSHPVALSTLATVHLRIATLPWIAKLMASDLPECSLDEAVEFARRAGERSLGIGPRLLLAKALLAKGEDAEARAVLEEVREAPDRDPRDALLRPGAEALLAEQD